MVNPWEATAGFQGNALNLNMGRENYGGGAAPDFWGDMMRIRAMIPARPAPGVVDEGPMPAAPTRGPAGMYAGGPIMEGGSPMLEGGNLGVHSPNGLVARYVKQDLNSLRGGGGIHEGTGYRTAARGEEGGMFAGYAAPEDIPTVAPFAPGTSRGVGGGGGPGSSPVADSCARSAGRRCRTSLLAVRRRHR